jgi:hypothetical protein
MSKTAEALTEKQETLPITQQHSNPWLEAAAESGNETGPLLKFVKGTWVIGDDALKDGTEFVAHIDQLIRGWVKFEDGRVVDRIIGKIADGFKPPKREDLSDADPASWTEKNADDGKLRDPWTQQWFLPLIGVESGELVTFVTGSKGGIGAVADLCRVYGHRQQHGLLPIIALKTRSYRHKQYGKIETPDFQVVGWDGAQTEAAAIPVQPTQLTEKATANNDDMDDEIPF